MNTNNNFYFTWDNEPDFVTEVDEETGYRYFITRIIDSGHLCGYVEISKNHPLYQKNYSDFDAQEEADVHGGITFSDFCELSDSLRVSCEFKEYLKNIPEQKIYFIGFNCNHILDIIPSKVTQYKEPGSTYKNIEFVRKECKKLCKFLKGKEKMINARKLRPLLSRNLYKKFKEIAEDALFLKEKGEVICRAISDYPEFNAKGRRDRLDLLDLIQALIEEIEDQMGVLRREIASQIKDLKGDEQ